MIDRDYFSHNIPGYGKVLDKLDAIGYCYKVAGENIGWNNYPDDVATAADPPDVHGLVRPPRQHPGQGLGRHRRSAPTRARPARRCGPSCSPTSAARPRPRPSRRRSRPPSPSRRRRPRPTARRRRRRDRRPSRAKATPEPTPAPTPDRPRPTPPIAGDDLIPGDAPDTEPSRRTPRSTRPTTATDGFDGAVGMRVVDRTSTDGLLETIVGGVTGFFFGG